MSEFPETHQQARARVKRLRRDLERLWREDRIKPRVYLTEKKNLENEQWDLDHRRCAVEGCSNLGRKNPNGSRQAVCERHRDEFNEESRVW